MSQGILITFFDQAPSLLYQPLELPSNHYPSNLLLALKKILNSQAIEEVMDRSSPGFYSRLFSGLQARWHLQTHHRSQAINLYLDIPSFKMETLLSIITALQLQEWITKIDLKDGYHHIPVHINIRKYFRFVIAGKPYQFCVLLFGLSTAPREFTKTLATVVQLLRSMGPCLSGQLDHPCLFSRSESSIYPGNHDPIAIFWLAVNWKKSMLTPSRIIYFLGLHFNPEKAIFSPPETFLGSLTQLPSCLSTSMIMPVRKLSSITSRISHFAPFIHHGCLHLRFLQFWIKWQWTQHRQSWDTPLQLDAEFLSHLRWFNRQDVLKGVPLHLPELNLFFFTDASLTGYGASWQSDSPSLLQQQYGSSSHRLTGRSFQVAFQQHTGNLSSSVNVWNSTHPNSSSRSQECSSRCPVSSEHFRSDRMAALSGNLTQALLCLRDLLRRHVRHGREQGDPNLHFTLPGRQSLGGRGPLNIVGLLRLSVCLPPAPIIPKTLQKIKDSQGTTVILIASQNPSCPWHPLLPLLLSQRPRIPLTNVPLYQYVPNRRQPNFTESLTC